MPRSSLEHLRVRGYSNTIVKPVPCRCLQVGLWLTAWPWFLCVHPRPSLSPALPASHSSRVHPGQGLIYLVHCFAEPGTRLLHVAQGRMLPIPVC